MLADRNFWKAKQIGWMFMLTLYMQCYILTKMYVGLIMKIVFYLMVFEILLFSIAYSTTSTSDVEMQSEVSTLLMIWKQQVGKKTTWDANRILNLKILINVRVQKFLDCTLVRCPWQYPELQFAIGSNTYRPGMQNCSLFFGFSTYDGAV